MATWRLVLVTCLITVFHVGCTPTEQIPVTLDDDAQTQTSRDAASPEDGAGGTAPADDSASEGDLADGNGGGETSDLPTPQQPVPEQPASPSDPSGGGQTPEDPAAGGDDPPPSTPDPVEPQPPIVDPPADDPPADDPPADDPPADDPPADDPPADDPPADDPPADDPPADDPPADDPPADDPPADDPPADDPPADDPPADDPPPQDPLADPVVLAPLLFGGGSFVTGMADHYVEFLVDTVFAASAHNGGVVTLHGTLTQSADQQWSYDPDPPDRLVSVFFGGQPIEFQITQFDGDTQSGASSVAWGQHTLQFNVFHAGECDLYIDSVATPTVQYTSSWQRHITGEAVMGDHVLDVDLMYTGERYWEIVGVYEDRSDEGDASGTIQIGDALITVADAYFKRHYLSGITVLEFFSIGTHSSAQVDGLTYVYDRNGENAGVRWELDAMAGTVYDFEYWICDGGLFLDDQLLGNIEFTGPVAPYTKGPDLELQFTNGQTALLHTLLQ